MTRPTRPARSRRADLRAAGLALALLAVAVAAGSASAERETRIYEARHRNAAELLPLARAVLSENASVTLDPHTHALVLIGEGSALDAAVAVLDRLDRARRSLVVHVTSHSLAALASAGYSVRWGGEGSVFALGRLADTRAEAGLRIDARVLRSARDESFSASLRILDGAIGVIRTGHALAITQHGLLDSSTSVLEAASGLLAQPRVLGDGRVELQIEPFEGELDPAGAVAFRGSSTTVVVAPGEPIAIAGTSSRGRHAGEQVFSARSSRQSSDDNVVIVWLEID